MQSISIPSFIIVYDDDTLDDSTVSSLEIGDLFGVDSDVATSSSDSKTARVDGLHRNQLMIDDSGVTWSTDMLSRWGSSGSLCVENMEEGVQPRCPQRQPSLEWEHWGTSDTVDTQVVPYKASCSSRRRRFPQRSFQENVSNAELSLHKMMARAKKLTKKYTTSGKVIARNSSSSSSAGEKSSKGSDVDAKAAAKLKNSRRNHKASALSPTLPKRQRTNRVTPATEENMAPPKLPARQRTNGKVTLPLN